MLYNLLIRGKKVRETTSSENQMQIIEIKKQNQTKDNKAFLLGGKMFPEPN